MNATRLIELLDSPEKPRVMVLGDLMLDVYTTGHAERISPEAPVVVLRARERNCRLGGAANVCQMLRGLDAEVTCGGVVGEDAGGRTVESLLDEAGINRDLLFRDPTRPTTTKERFLVASSSRNPTQILRVDHEHRDPICTALEENLIRGLCKKIADQDALLISDYGKGACTSRLVQAAIRAAQHSGIPVLVDPLPGGSYVAYTGATMIKPNRVEAELATGIRIVKPVDALQAGRQLCEQFHLQCAVVTLDRDGIVLVDRDGTERIFPTTTQTVCDITGAGDMVLAALGYCLASGFPLPEAIQLANIAAGLEVQQIGVAVVRRQEIRQELLSRRREGKQKVVTLEQAVELAQMHRRRGEKISFTNGCFDLLHVGHLAALTSAASCGDVLFVAANSDASVKRLKGQGRPIIRQQDRAAMLAALECVTYVVVFDDETPHRLLEAIRPDVLVKGGTYSVDEVVGNEVVLRYGGEVRVTEVIDQVSTTNILHKAVDRSSNGDPRRHAA